MFKYNINIKILIPFFFREKILIPSENIEIINKFWNLKNLYTIFLIHWRDGDVNWTQEPSYVAVLILNTQMIGNNFCSISFYNIFPLPLGFINLLFDRFIIKYIILHMWQRGSKIVSLVIKRASCEDLKFETHLPSLPP